MGIKGVSLEAGQSVFHRYGREIVVKEDIDETHYRGQRPASRDLSGNVVKWIDVTPVLLCKAHTNLHKDDKLDPPMKIEPAFATQ